MPYYIFWGETILTDQIKCIDSKTFFQIDVLNFLKQTFLKIHV
jgi:hypothetical protein